MGPSEAIPEPKCGWGPWGGRIGPSKAAATFGGRMGPSEAIPKPKCGWGPWGGRIGPSKAAATFGGRMGPSKVSPTPTKRWDTWGGRIGPSNTTFAEAVLEPCTAIPRTTKTALVASSNQVDFADIICPSPLS